MTGKLISACMMVKNEEGNLPRCLSSLKDFVDEIIIVDTGSTDKTMEIAKQFGDDNNVQVSIYEHPWENDFSKHRNQSLSYVKTQWGFIIDADEELCLKTGVNWKQIRRFFYNVPSKYPASAIEFKDIHDNKEVMNFNSTRFFRKGKAQYYGIVHNQPKVDGEALFCSDIYLKHYGYDLTPEQKQVKFQRTTSLLFKQIEKGEMDQCFPYYYLCQQFADNGNIKEAVVWGEKYIAEKPNITIFNDQIYFTLIRQYMALGDNDNVRKWLEVAVKELPGNIDIASAAFDYAIQIGDEVLQYQAGKDYIEAYQRYEKNPGLKKNMFIFSMRPEVVAIVLKRLVELQLAHASADLTNMINACKRCPEKLRNELFAELERNVAGTTFPVRFHKKEEKGGN